MKKFALILYEGENPAVSKVYVSFENRYKTTHLTLNRYDTEKIMCQVYVTHSYVHAGTIEQFNSYIVDTVREFLINEGVLDNNGDLEKNFIDSVYEEERNEKRAREEKQDAYYKSIADSEGWVSTSNPPNRDEDVTVKFSSGRTYSAFYNGTEFCPLEYGLKFNSKPDFWKKKN